MPKPSTQTHSHIHEPVPISKSKMKLTQGVAAGAEDQKYHAKYRDLKKKVKELETVRVVGFRLRLRSLWLIFAASQDNDRLHFKVLEARKKVTRMKLERA